MRNLGLSMFASVAILAVNFSIFLYSYNSLTATLLTEDQRIDNADFVMTATLPMYAVSSILFGLLIAALLKGRTSNNK